MLNSAQCGHLWADFAGQLFLTNLANQLQAEVVDEVFVRQLGQELAQFDNLNDYFIALESGKTNSHFQAKKIPDEHEITLLCRIARWDIILDSIKPDGTNGTLIPSLRTDFTSVKGTLSQSNIDVEEERLLRNFDGICQVIDDQNLHWLACELDINKFIDLNDKPKPVFCTSLNKQYPEGHIFVENARRADCARDVLGLVHFDNSHRDWPFVPLGAIEFDFDGSHEYCRPTVADAASHSRFKGVYGKMENKTGNWGRAFDLSTLGEAAGKKGAREIVVENHRPEKISIRFLGFVRVPRKDRHCDGNDIFINSCLNRQSETDIKNCLSER